MCDDLDNNNSNLKNSEKNPANFAVCRRQAINGGEKYFINLLMIFIFKVQEAILSFVITLPGLLSLGVSLQRGRATPPLSPPPDWQPDQ